MGMALARRYGEGLLGRLGRGIVLTVPPFLKALTVVGTLAMLWVGGSLLLHGLAHYGYAGPEHWIAHMAEMAAHAVPSLGSALAWLVTAAFQGLFALAAGGVVVALFGLVRWRKAPAEQH